MRLPPGPSAPPPWQTLRWLARPVGFLLDCERRHGEAFTLRIAGAGRVVMIGDPAAIKELWKRDRTSGVPRSRQVTLGPLVGSRSLLIIEGEPHMRRRRIMSPPFHGDRMRAYADVVREVTEADVAAWPRGEAFPLQPRMQSITLEVIVRAVFGLRAGARRDEIRSLMIEALRLATTAGGQLAAVLPAAGRVPGLGRFGRTIARLDELLLAEIDERRRAEDLAGREDVLSLLVQATDEEGRPLDDRDLRDQLMTLLAAGHETTATSLSWTFDALFRHPEAASRLREEIDAGDDAYLNAVIRESLRTRPVVPVAGRRTGEPLPVGRYEVPPGTFVTPAILLVHRRPDLYPDPLAFRPERFLEGAPDTYAWVPFGGGIRRCIGAAFAEMEMREVLRSVVGGLELRPADGAQEAAVRRTVTIAPRHGTRAVLEGLRHGSRRAPRTAVAQ